MMKSTYLFILRDRRSCVPQTAYINWRLLPVLQNYEISKTRKFKKDISRREYMEYHADRDSYICRNGRELTVTNERRSKTASGDVAKLIQQSQTVDIVLSAGLIKTAIVYQKNLSSDSEYWKSRTLLPNLR